ncbi:integrase [Sphingomonas vulcanisoli]|uniref:Integrase n=1 Tax=Sphingomonas vulcanisoli TaxID=1658060 RepID=A0ABX0TVI5_9SPHN|nr:integrase arm-type DNA-binding domain-containing protein [Sphingomonas vulcanisoli]NIJ09527.1 integrase [Sphingomonas vulcanisoli]
MTLTHIQITHAKATNKAFRMSDGRGLAIVIQPCGSKIWRWSYRFETRQKTLHIGIWPKVGIADARRKCEQARELLSEGIDPAIVKRFGRGAAKIKIAPGNSFRVVAEEWLRKLEQEGLADITIGKTRWLLDKAYAALGSLPIEVIRPVDALAALKKIEAKGHYETARRLRSVLSRVFRYGVATGRIERDVAADLRGAIVAPKAKNLAAITTSREAGQLIRAIEAYSGCEITSYALKLSAHLFVRPGELRRAEWREFDVDACVWMIPAEKMKKRRPHQVPLSRQVMELLDNLHDLTGHDRYVFPCLGKQNVPMSENTVNQAIRRLGYGRDEMTAHGFRAMAATLLNESGLWHPDAIERQLAHLEANQIRRAYTRGEYWPERVRLMQWWSDYVDDLRKEEPAPVSTFGTRFKPALRSVS